MRNRDRIPWIEYYQNKTDRREMADWDTVAEWVLLRDYPVPKLPTVVQVVAKQLARAPGRRYDAEVSPGRLERKYLCIPTAGDGSGWPWFHVDDSVPRRKMDRMSRFRFEGIIGSPTELLDDTGRCNRRNPDEEPIRVPVDHVGFDVELQRNSHEEELPEKTG